LAFWDEENFETFTVLIYEIKDLPADIFDIESTNV
jgi:hypothetical protein